MTGGGHLASVCLPPPKPADHGGSRRGPSAGGTPSTARVGAAKGGDEIKLFVLGGGEGDVHK